MNALSPSLFAPGEIPSAFESAKDRYGLWPVTVWELNHQDALESAMKCEVGDDGEGRENCFTTLNKDTRSVYGGKVPVSIFSPTLALHILNLWAPESGLCLDPFCGGGTRAIVAARYGLLYAGTELRRTEAEWVMGRAEANGLADKINIYVGDARVLHEHVGPAAGDFCYTCPPYWNLERYRGGARDLSECATYADYVDGVEQVAKSVALALKTGALSAWVVGLHRGRGGELLPLHHGIAEAHRRAGFLLLEEVIVHHTNTGSIQRVGQFEKGNRHLVRTHEYVMLFRNSGDIR